MLSKGEFRDLYVYGYDSPEAYAIEKDGKMYYAFFAPAEKPAFQGEVELRGLKPGTYQVVDYAEGKDLGTVQAEAGNAPRLKTEFKEHLLLEVSGK
jgi:alpha-galactosidase